MLNRSEPYSIGLLVVVSVEYLSIANIFNAVTHIFIFLKNNLKLSILSFHTFANNIWLEEMW